MRGLLRAGMRARGQAALSLPHCEPPSGLPRGTGRCCRAICAFRMCGVVRADYLSSSSATSPCIARSRGCTQSVKFVSHRTMLLESLVHN